MMLSSTSADDVVINISRCCCWFDLDSTRLTLLPSGWGIVLIQQLWPINDDGFSHQDGKPKVNANNSHQPTACWNIQESYFLSITLFMNEEEDGVILPCLLPFPTPVTSFTYVCDDVKLVHSANKEESILKFFYCKKTMNFSDHFSTFYLIKGEGACVCDQ